MTRALKLHLLRPDDHLRALCGKVTENASSDHEETSRKSCSGMYRTNMEWYSQVRNKAVEANDDSGDRDLYTRMDLEVGLMRLGWDARAIDALLDNTAIFRAVHLVTGRPLSDPWGREVWLKGGMV